MNETSRTGHMLARVLGSVALLLGLAASPSAHPAGAAPGRAGLVARPLAYMDGAGLVARPDLPGRAPLMSAGAPRAVTAGLLGPRRTGMLPRGPAVGGRGHAAWATLPAGLRATLARLGLGPTDRTARPPHGSEWAMGARSPRPRGARPACQCGGGGGPTWSQQAELTTSNGTGGDEFGVSVALSSDGNTALIGAIGVNNKGAAYVFARGGSAWSQQAELTAADGTSNDNFGRSVALSSDGNTALIGAPFKNNATGAAYIFVHSGGAWSQQAELTAADGASDDNFGIAVALGTDSNTAASVALIGAYGKNNFTGAAYVFVPFFGWNQEAELTAADGASADQFGVAVALNGDGGTALIGAYGKNLSTGAAYIFSTSPIPTPTSTPANTPTNTSVPPTNTPTATPTNTPPAASLVVSPTSATPFQTITVSGTSFGPVEVVKLSWDSTTAPPLTTTTTTAGGSFVAHLSVPQAVAGPHSVKAVGQTSGRTASAPLTVKPAVVLSPSHGTAGSLTTLIGVGFGGSETVAALWYPGLKPLKSGPSTALGTVALSFTVPLSPTGSYAVLGYGLSTKLYAAAPFQVTASALAPAAGAPWGTAAAAQSSGGWGVYGTSASGIGGNFNGGTGWGVLGNGKIGVQGSGSSVGVVGTGAYGGYFAGSVAALHVAPAPTAGPPSSGAHLQGDLVVDSAGILFICTASGTPGTWVKVSTQ